MRSTHTIVCIYYKYKCKYQLILFLANIYNPGLVVDIEKRSNDLDKDLDTQDITDNLNENSNLTVEPTLKQSPRQSKNLFLSNILFIIIF